MHFWHGFPHWGANSIKQPMLKKTSRLFFPILAALAFTGCAKEVIEQPAVKSTEIQSAESKPSLITTTTLTSKKGLALSDKYAARGPYLSLAKVSWYYNWNIISLVTNSPVQYVPMVWGTKHFPYIKGPYPILLGFNEPDHLSQANMTPTQALSYWSKLTSVATRVGSPATAKSLLNANNWLDQFLLGKPRVDFITVHWYKGVDAQRFISDMTGIYNKYKKPIWVTEFAPQYRSQAAAEPYKYSQAQVDYFMRTVTTWMNNTSFIERYAWHDIHDGTSALFTAEGNLTATGRTYAAVK